jgi:hypothetical protein
MKEKQAEFYNVCQGARSLTPLKVGDKVLVWNMDARLWRTPAVVIKVVNNRSYIVRRQDGGTLRSNKQQLQLRPTPYSSKVFDEDDDEKESRGEESEKAEQIKVGEEASGVDGRQQVVVRTRSGREVRQQGWRNE